MDNIIKTLYQMIEHLKIGLVISCTLLCITFKLLLDLFNALLLVLVSFVHFIGSIGGLLIPIIVFITSVEKIFTGDPVISQICIKAPQVQKKCLTITDAD